MGSNVSTGPENFVCSLRTACDHTKESWSKAVVIGHSFNWQSKNKKWLIERYFVSTTTRMQNKHLGTSSEVSKIPYLPKLWPTHVFPSGFGLSVVLGAAVFTAAASAQLEWAVAGWFFSQLVQQGVSVTFWGLVAPAWCRAALSAFRETQPDHLLDSAFSNVAGSPVSFLSSCYNFKLERNCHKQLAVSNASAYHHFSCLNAFLHTEQQSKYWLGRRPPRPTTIRFISLALSKATMTS